jgi:hypothetical protein
MWWKGATVLSQFWNTVLCSHEYWRVALWTGKVNGSVSMNSFEGQWCNISNCGHYLLMKYLSNFLPLDVVGSLWRLMHDLFVHRRRWVNYWYRLRDRKNDDITCSCTVNPNLEKLNWNKTKYLYITCINLSHFINTVTTYDVLNAFGNLTVEHERT